jgi:hypothetical protein
MFVAPLAVVLIFHNWTATIGTTTPISLKLDWWAKYEPVYLFWSGIVLTIVLLGILIITLLWPRTYSLYLHQKTYGQVTVSKKAIENFTLSALQKEPFIGNPSVSAKISRNRIKLKISGSLLNSINAKQSTEKFLDQFKSDLSTCLGITERKKIKIKLVKFNDRKSNMNLSRVN